mmetsp:Transcript_7921/g.17112  ORF Transcript_7921/g.17112 Transcript_7921/m.17112 type:complete len:117 (+) Transcript_7921:365-715(+)
MSNRVKPHSTNYDRILGAEGGQIGGGVLAAAAPPPLAIQPPWTSRGLGAFPSIVVRIGVVERLQKRYSNPNNAVRSSPTKTAPPHDVVIQSLLRGVGYDESASQRASRFHLATTCH